LNLSAERNSLMKKANCTNCGAQLNLNNDNPISICDYCKTTVNVSDALGFSKVQIDHELDIRKLRDGLAKAVRLNNIDEILRISQQILDWLPTDYEANYYFSYAKEGLNQPQFMIDFLTNSDPLDNTIQLKVFDHIIKNSDLRKRDLIVEYFKKHNSESIEQYLSILEDRIKKEENYSLTPRDVFICHSSKDQKLADKLVSIIESDGYTCWISHRNLRPYDNENYWVNITHAIQSSQVFILVSSSSSYISQDVQKEVQIAKEKNKNRFEIKIDASAQTSFIKYSFDGIKWIDIADATMESFKEVILKRVFENVNRVQINDIFESKSIRTSSSEISKKINTRIVIPFVAIIIIVASLLFFLLNGTDLEQGQIDSPIVDAEGKIEIDEFPEEGQIIVNDTTAPLIDLVSNQIHTHVINTTYKDPFVRVTDIEDANPTLNVIGLDQVSSIGKHVVNYQAVDSAGNRSLFVQREIHVIPQVESYSIWELTNQLFNNGVDILYLDNGNTIIVGYSRTTINPINIGYMIMINENKEIQWIRTYQSSDVSSENPNYILSDAVLSLLPKYQNGEDAVLIQYQTTETNATNSFNSLTEQIVVFEIIDLDGNLLAENSFIVNQLLTPIRTFPIVEYPKWIFITNHVVIEDKIHFYVVSNFITTMSSTKTTKHQYAVILSTENLALDSVKRNALESIANKNPEILLKESNNTGVYHVGTEISNELNGNELFNANSFGMYTAFFTTNGDITYSKNHKIPYISANEIPFRDDLYRIYNAFVVPNQGTSFIGGIDMIITVGESEILDDNFRTTNTDSRVSIRSVRQMANNWELILEPSLLFPNRHRRGQVIKLNYSYYHEDLDKIIVAIEHGFPDESSFFTTKSENVLLMINRSGIIENILPIDSLEMTTGYRKSKYILDGRVAHLFYGTIIYETTLTTDN